MIKYVLTNESVTVTVDGKTHTVQKGSPNYTALRRALSEEDWDSVPKNLTITKSMKEYVQGKITYDEARHVFMFDSEDLPVDLNRKIVSMATAGEDPSGLFKFWERLQKNPSWRSVKQTFAFLAHENIPIQKDGSFIAYKGVKHDYTDKYTGKLSNKPGTIHKMPRNKISDDPNETCHFGFHVGALGYAKSFGAIVVMCQVYPENVVCVPRDAGQQKMRVCEYKVLGNYGAPLPSTTFEEDVHPEPEDDDNDTKAPAESDNPSDNITSLSDARAKLVTALQKKADEAPNADAQTDSTQQAPAPKKAKKEKPKKEEDGSTTTAPKTVPEEFKPYLKMSMEELMKESIETLRKVATFGLFIVGASKIPGGKAALVARMLEVRHGRKAKEQEKN